MNKNLENTVKERESKPTRSRPEGETEWTEYISDSNQNFALNIAEGNEKPIPIQVSNEVNTCFALDQIGSIDSKQFSNSEDFGRNHSAL